MILNSNIMKRDNILCGYLLMILYTHCIVCDGATLEERVLELEYIVRNQYKELTHRIVVLESEQVDYRVAIGELKNRVLALEVDSRADERKPNETNEYNKVVRTKTLKRAAQPQGVQVPTTRHPPTREAAFHVYLSSERCYSQHDPFIFDRKGLVIGSGYNFLDGIYTVPVSGIYVFSWTVAAPNFRYNKSWFVAELVANGLVIGTIVTDANVDALASGDHPSTGLVISNVNVGDRVFIRFVKGSGCHVQSDALVRTTFSGWLLY